MRFLPLWTLAILFFLLFSLDALSKTASVKSLETPVPEKPVPETPVIVPPQILWAVPDWPPFFIRDKTQPPGIANEMLQLLQNHLTAYHHEDLDINSAKLVELWKQGRKVCGSNMLYNGERAKYGYFTPLWVYPPLHVIVKEESIESFTKGAKTINVFELIKNSHFKGILIKGRSYGPPVDEIVAGLSEREFVNVISLQGNWLDYLNILSNSRADYTIDYAKVAKTFNEGHPKSKRLAAIPIVGYEKPFIVNVACIKNEWGKAVVKELDRKIQTMAKEQDYRDLLGKVFANEPSNVQQKDIDQFILKRAKGSWIWGDLD